MLPSGVSPRQESGYPLEEDGDGRNPSGTTGEARVSGQAYKRQRGTRIYGRTKPGTLLKHHIPIRTERWTPPPPGFTEIDLVSHSGDCADGEFIHSLNLTDMHTTWVETRAVLGKGEVRVQEALETMRQVLPFRLRGIDSDNGSEFINHHLYRYGQRKQIQFTRGAALQERRQRAH